MTMSRLLLSLASMMFVLAASYKVGVARPLEQTLVSLGVPGRVARRASRLAPAAEIGLAAAAVCPWSALTGGGMAIAGLIVLLAGVLGSRTGAHIPCNCFNIDSGHELGSRQVIVGLALAGLAFVALLSPTRFSARQSVLTLTVALLTVCVVRLSVAAQSTVELVRLRRAFSTQYPA